MRERGEIPLRGTKVVKFHVRRLEKRKAPPSEQFLAPYNQCLVRLITSEVFTYHCIPVPKHQNTFTGSEVKHVWIAQH